MKRQPVLSEEMPTFIGIDYSVLNAQGENLGEGRIDHAHREDFPRAGATMAWMPSGL